jgi:hypothetical protein
LFAAVPAAEPLQISMPTAMEVPTKTANPTAAMVIDLTTRRAYVGLQHGAYCCRA